MRTCPRGWVRCWDAVDLNVVGDIWSRRIVRLSWCCEQTLLMQTVSIRTYCNCCQVMTADHYWRDGMPASQLINSIWQLIRRVHELTFVCFSHNWQISSQTETKCLLRPAFPNVFQTLVRPRLILPARPTVNVFQTETIIHITIELNDWWNCFDEAVISLHTHVSGWALAWPRPDGLPGPAIEPKGKDIVANNFIF